VPTATAFGRVILWWAVTDALDIGRLFPKITSASAQNALSRALFRSSPSETGHRYFQLWDWDIGQLLQLDYVYEPAT
jgi:hypothetical protein